MKNKDVSKVMRKSIFKSAILPVKRYADYELPSEALVKVAVTALEEVKAKNIEILDIRDKQGIIDFMIIATGTSNRQLCAMLDKVSEAVKAQGVQPLGEEGKDNSDWVLLDVDNVIIHMMTSIARQFYDLEGLWNSAEKSCAVDVKDYYQ
ncbi:ribosome silencing factor [Candidatus Pseudomonas adelgestsugas]|uniref:Ribosomal silencing factor RsfS n=1 Tax=Candidatus Pseudomonas adelgestsugas TaxID=1302376 RepID=A0ABX5R859_9PSED|nr:ribosome silencing factor [Candidatus Pseudomonas adelgestsugas]QAX81679.1 Ribosomal silencing factor RsfS [Candidatus Pseudomonas adelgestsugas]